MSTLIPYIFRILQGITPDWAARLALQLFTTPIRYKRPDREQQFFTFMNRERVAVSFQREQLYDVAYARGKTLTHRFNDDTDKNYFTVYHGGSGPHILLVHGWSGRASQFVTLAEKLINEGFSVYSFDAFGHGDSPGRHASMLEFLWLIRKMDALYGPFQAIVGHSLGGIAGGFAIQEGMKVPRLVTIGSPATWQFIIENYVQMIGANQRTREFLENFTLRFTQRTAQQFSLAWAMEQTDVDGIIIHDQNDREVPYHQALILKDHWSRAGIYTTENLGHHRILRDVKVIRRITAFLSAALVAN
ncbi:MAG: alpha/beta fold hydrolase [Calditrichaeota bacterium]|nr:MAG: alpha/beta fold hydrolase [Calditrichota bacterium]